jgi:hypothetical protein
MMFPNYKFSPVSKYEPGVNAMKWTISAFIRRIERLFAIALKAPIFKQWKQLAGLF